MQPNAMVSIVLFFHSSMNINHDSFVSSYMNYDILRSYYIVLKYH